MCKKNFRIYNRIYSVFFILFATIFNNGYAGGSQSKQPHPGWTYKNTSSQTWMQDNIEILKDLTLKNICMPGSHHSGMSKTSLKTTLGFPFAVVTQEKNILDQLNCGVRYFDIRPVINNENFYSGNYLWVEDIPGIFSTLGNVQKGLQGACGQSIEEIVDQINLFCQDKQELIIIELSHAYNIDNDIMTFDSNESDKLFKILGKIDCLYLNSEINDLTTLSIGNLINNQKSAVIVIVRDHTIPCVEYTDKKIFLKDTYPIYHAPAHKNDIKATISDQIQKLKTEKKEESNKIFVMDWVVTQDKEQAKRCFIAPIIDNYMFLSLENPYFYPSTLVLAAQINAKIARVLSSLVIISPAFFLHYEITKNKQFYLTIN